MGSKKSAGRRAGEAANLKIDEGLDFIKEQFGETKESFQPFIDAGLQGLEGVQQGSTIGGFGDRLDEIFNSGALDGLIDQRTRGAQSQLAAGGLTRSGTGVQEIAGIPQELAFALEQQLTGRQSGLANQGFGAISNIGNLGAGQAGAIGGLLGQQGQNTSSGIITDAQSSAAFGGQILGLGSKLAFSDPRLKKNVERIADLGNLGVYQWDWIDGAKGTSIEGQPTIGFMADEVGEKYPEYVGEVATWKAINYGPLVELLREKYKVEEGTE
jgi:hypothetical protein